MSDDILATAKLICVDWGTSNFRAFLLDSNANLLDSIRSDKGMLGLAPEEFEPNLYELLKPWLRENELPIIMAGMVGSVRGWQNTSYITCPIEENDLSSELTYITNNRQLKLAIISGIETSDKADQYDVARGEEVQVFGAFELIVAKQNETAIFCLPGTHSKWVVTKNKTILSFTTHMTGELFDILSHNSILAPQKPYTKKTANDVFKKGLDCAQKSGGLAHHIFSARTNMLKGHIQNDEIESYLSGVLIGTEIKEMTKAISELESTDMSENIYLVGNENLNKIYAEAMNHLGLATIQLDGEKTAYRGMFSIALKAGMIKE